MGSKERAIDVEAEGRTKTAGLGTATRLCYEDWL